MGLCAKCRDRFSRLRHTQIINYHIVAVGCTVSSSTNSCRVEMWVENTQGGIAQLRTQVADWEARGLRWGQNQESLVHLHAC